ncbi:MAG: Holliday junction branch migration protein RuvA [Clostridia bacterium]|nr:Holliday junction branch migration protein RuvA [Lachnospiraceae bacterium]NCC00583.1 Holliday junction branch migration protein RuvA [Clostridia bacterium]NCD02011.1 Holliday junction branch migration protein RuvA [Clostridia bacterium]
MISFIRGSLAEIGLDYIVLDNQGVGYLIYTPASVIEELPMIGEKVQIHTYMYVREDQLSLYGFLTRDDLQIFKLLIGVSGIGPKGALGILSTISPNQLRLAVLSGDSKTIGKAPGIGPKTAQKLIIELKDKLKLEDIYEDDLGESTGNGDLSSGAGKEAMLALVSLGYSETEAFKALKRVEVTPDMDSETLLKLALKQMLTL